MNHDIHHIVLERLGLKVRRRIPWRIFHHTIESMEDRAAEQMVLDMEAELWVAMLEPIRKRENVHVADVPSGRWQHFRAALGLAHKTRPIYREVVTEYKTVTPFAVDMQARPDQQRIHLAVQQPHWWPWRDEAPR